MHVHTYSTSLMKSGQPGSYFFRRAVCNTLANVTVLLHAAGGAGSAVQHVGGQKTLADVERSKVAGLIINRPAVRRDRERAPENSEAPTAMHYRLALHLSQCRDISFRCVLSPADTVGN